jgi:peptidoglycan/LPS O-acetylase OafA/YrhL
METKDRKKQTFLFWSLVILGILCAVLANLPGLKIDLAKNFFTIFIPYIGYFYAGAYLRSIQISKVQAVVLGALYLILAFITNMIAKGNMSAFIVFNYGPTLFPMSIFLFLALKNIDQFFKNKIFSRGIITLIPFIASTTFGIYLLHFMVLDLVRKYFKLYPWQVHAPLVLYACLPAVLTFLITFTIVLLARKIPYSKYIFG